MAEESPSLPLRLLPGTEGWTGEHPNVQNWLRASPPQAAPPRAAHLVVLLKQPLQELVAQVVELRGAAGRNAEPVGREPSEPPQAPNEGQHVSGSLAKPDLTPEHVAPHSLPAQGQRLSPGLAIPQHSPLPWGRLEGDSDLSSAHPRCPSSRGHGVALALPRARGFSRAQHYPRGAFHQHGPSRLPSQPAAWGEDEAAHKPNPFITARSPPPGWQRAEKRQQLQNQPGGLC